MSDIAPAETPLLEATVIRPGDRLIVRVEAALTQADAAEIKRRLKDQLPLLADVTVVRANGLYVFRDEIADLGSAHA